MQILISYICLYIYIFIDVSKMFPKQKKNRKSYFHVSKRIFSAYPFSFPCNLGMDQELIISAPNQNQITFKPSGFSENEPS